MSMRQILATFALAVGLAVGLAACAGSQSTTADDEPAAESGGSGAASTPASQQGKTRAIQKRVHFEKILGTPLKPGERVTGCHGNWDPIEKGRFPGEAFFCSEFNGPERWGHSPVTFTIQNGKLSVIAIQIYYDGMEDAKEEYQDFSSALLDRCERKTGFDKNIILDCDGHFIDVSWQGHHETGQMEVIYALSFDDLPK